MAEIGLITWAGQQPPWVQDSLRRIAIAGTVSKADHQAVLQRVRHAVFGDGPAPTCEPIGADHLAKSDETGPRVALASIGPVQNIDRLAADQQLRFAPRGITLIFGENGSGKSGYARITKRLCRSVSTDALKGDIFLAQPAGPPTVRVRYQVGDAPVAALDWTPEATAPSALRQISVFDSRSASLYVDQQNRIAYMPAEIAILEQHGELCTELAEIFATDQRAITGRVKTPLPAGYGAGGAVQALLNQLDVRTTALPAKADFEALAAVGDVERQELLALERRLAQDPMALAATRRRGVDLLARLVEVFKELEAGLSHEVAAKLTDLRREAASAVTASHLAATEQFASEPLPGVGQGAWRLLYEAARGFVLQAGLDLPGLPQEPGEPCALCQSPLDEAAARRLARFNAFMKGEAAKRADAARAVLAAAVTAIEALVVPPVQTVSDALAAYAVLDPRCASLLARIEGALAICHSRRGALIAAPTEPAAEVPEPAPALCEALMAEMALLRTEIEALERDAAHSTGLDQARSRLGELRDRIKLADDLATVLARLTDLETLQGLKACAVQVSTRAVSLQISKLRARLVTESLQRRIQAEIANLDLAHIPFKVTNASQQGKSWFGVGLSGATKAINREVLSEGEQRALALACFLAEMGDDGDRYGLIVDDPVSSLDQRRIRLVAERLAREAAKGRQVVIFTHNLVFFNEVVAAATRQGEAAPLMKMVVRKTQAQGFGVVEEDSEPWIALDVTRRLTALEARAKALTQETDLAGEAYRRQAKDFYTDLRETWERCVEETVLNKTVERLVPDVMTKRLNGVIVTDDDYRTIYLAMGRVSERSGHDMPVGRDIAVPTPAEMVQDIQALRAFNSDYRTRRKAAMAHRATLEEPVKADLL
jgi:energy-coupling factor transporter ATP-binding protein EcfA2